MVEGARLESVYTSKGYRGFESLTLRLRPPKHFSAKAVFFWKFVSNYLRNLHKNRILHIIYVFKYEEFIGNI